MCSHQPLYTVKRTSLGPNLPTIVKDLESQWTQPIPLIVQDLNMSCQSFIPTSAATKGQCWFHKVWANKSHWDEKSLCSLHLNKENWVKSYTLSFQLWPCNCKPRAQQIPGNCGGWNWESWQTWLRVTILTNHVALSKGTSCLMTASKMARLR
jgi:hypothetical protein